MTNLNFYILRQPRKRTGEPEAYCAQLRVNGVLEREWFAKTRAEARRMLASALERGVSIPDREGN